MSSSPNKVIFPSLTKSRFDGFFWTSGEEREKPQVFISYQWSAQDDVTALRKRIEASGYSCWMDVGQLGAGDELFARIDDGIRNACAVVVCITPKYVTSQWCTRELLLADLLHKPIIPVLLESTPWPPRGSLALALSQLVYIDLKGACPQCTNPPSIKFLSLTNLLAILLIILNQMNYATFRYFTLIFGLMIWIIENDPL